MERPISFWGYKEQESNLILPEHDDDNDDDDVLWEYKEKQFFRGHNISTVGVFVTQLSCNAGITFWRIVWATTACRFMSDIVSELFMLPYVTVSQN